MLNLMLLFRPQIVKKLLITVDNKKFGFKITCQSSDWTSSMPISEILRIPIPTSIRRWGEPWCGDAPWPSRSAWPSKAQMRSNNLSNDFLLLL